MALTPTSNSSDPDKLAVRRAAEQDVLVREVDEAVRQDEATEFFRQYGKAIVALVIVGLLAFGGWLWWKDHREAQSRIYGTRTRIRSMPSAGVRDEARPPRADGMRLYPNPTDGTVTIEGHFGDAGETTVDIITPLGAIARTRTLPAAGAGEVFATLDIGELPAGICLVRVRHGSHASVEKIVKR